MREQRKVEGAAALRAFAHRLRQEIYELLVLHGPMTATALGDALDETPANCSWHLRKLAEHGFVEEAPGAKGRQRPWQATSMGLSWGEHEADDEAQRAGTAVSRMLLDRERSRLDASMERRRTDAPQWREAGTVSQSLLWLTAEELAELTEQLHTLARAKIDRVEDPALRPPGSRLCSFVAWAVPTYDVADPTPDGRD